MDAKDFFKSFGNNLTETLNVALVGRIESFNQQDLLANVQPLYPGYPLLINLPVMKLGGRLSVTPIYERGDVVVILVADKDIDNLLISGAAKPLNSSRKHALEDSIVLGGINTLNRKNKGTGLIVGGQNASITIKDNNIDIKVGQNASATITDSNIDIKVGQNASITITDSNIDIKGDLTINGKAVEL